MKYKYRACSVCDSKVDAIRANLNYTYKQVAYLIRNVPVGSCRQCTEMYVVSHISRLIERFLELDQASDTPSSPPVIYLPRDVVGF